jgi:hypothetical protein
MPRTAIELLHRSFRAAYRGDPFHAFRQNLESVSAAEWDVRPQTWSAEVFGTLPELSIRDLAWHVGGAAIMYTNRAFGTGRLEWADIPVPTGQDIATTLGWLDDAHAGFAAGIEALGDDADLAVLCDMPGRAGIRRDQMIGLQINHFVYHAGEVNRQRALIRGATGWDSPRPASR